ncbi:MAG TPA: hypothetical protein VIT89_00565 [Solirubrobacterales bacterium]
MAENDDPNPNPDKPKAEGNLTSIGMLVAPLVAAMGALALTGTIGRVQRDYPEWFSVALILVVASGVLWVAAPSFPSWRIGSRVQFSTLAKAAAFVAGGAGFMLALALAVSTADNTPRPQITPTLSEDGSKLTAKITASNLPTDQRLVVKIDLLEGRQGIASIYESYMGPDGDGNIDQTVAIPLPKSGFSEIGVMAHTGDREAKCDDFEAVAEDEEFRTGTGCVIIALPEYVLESKR